MYEIKKIDEGHLGLFATENVKEGTVILWLSKDSTYLPYPTRTSIQVKNRHLEHYEGGCTNHSCNPTAKVVSVMWGLEGRAHFIPFEALSEKSKLNPVLIACKDILSGEEITFDYETTEFELATPFKCDCHGNWIRGKVHRYQE